LATLTGTDLFLPNLYIYPGRDEITIRISKALAYKKGFGIPCGAIPDVVYR
jgi:hypothetical protein